MKNDIERLQWAIRFGQGQMEPAVVRRDLDGFMKVPGGHIIAVPNPETRPETLSDADVQALQGDVEAVIDITSEGSDGGLLPQVSIERQVLVPKRKGARRSKPSDRSLIVLGPLRDVVLEVLYQLLLSAPVERVRRCPGCGAKFFRRGRQTHCTPDCYDRAYWASLPTETLERYRAKQYDAMGWTRGARLQQIATKSLTGGKKRPQLRDTRHKKARQSPSGKRQA